MRVLFLTQVLPYPLDAGPKVRAYYTLRFLAQDHEVTLLSFVRSSDPPEAIAHLHTVCQAVYTVPMQRSRLRDGWHFVRSLLNGTPFLIARDWVPDMATTLETVLTNGHEFDVIHADQLWMAPYALHAKRAANGADPFVVLDQHNAVFQIPRRLAQSESNPIKQTLLRFESKKLERYEWDLCQQFDRVVWVTEEDKLALEDFNARRRHVRSRERSNDPVIPICVAPAGRSVVAQDSNPYRVTFLGGLHWPPNAAGVSWFVREVWPLVRRTAPGAVLTVIGKSPPADLVAMSTSDASIDVTGYVADLRPSLEETAAFIVPLHAGGGMRVKLLDAWSWGLPVVSTRIGAEGIKVDDGENVLLADTPEAFADAVVRLLVDGNLRERLAEAGRRTVEAQYDWRKVYGAWETVYPGEHYAADFS